MTLRAVSPGARCRETRRWRCGSAQPVGHCRQDGDGEEAVSPPLGDTEQVLVGDDFSISARGRSGRRWMGHYAGDRVK